VYQVPASVIILTTRSVVSGTYAQYPLALDMYPTSTLLISDNVSQSTLAGQNSMERLDLPLPSARACSAAGKRRELR
jgi:hypothetical protein